ncbi:MAG: YhfC family intramembrane metalloprotease [Candidatus Riflebacteria bacterium]|nr:YhfC family intramembrane metalloprotease [Candidatus Riflebacteria bacterium]
MELAKVGTEAFILLVLAAILSFVIPLLIAIVWKKKKKEPFSTILIGAATFLLFALILEKPIQALVISKNFSLGIFLSSHPLLLAFIIGLFPGIFEETGRLLAFKTLLKNRKNKETSISYGIGHGCFEVMAISGINYITSISFACMINSGAFVNIINQLAEKAPDQVGAYYTLADQIAKFSIFLLGAGIIERTFAVLLQIGLSILVFYACKDKKKFWLFPLAIILHTLTDLSFGLNYVKVTNFSILELEIIIAIFGIITFCSAYFLLYKKDSEEQVQNLEMIADRKEDCLQTKLEE